MSQTHKDHNLVGTESNTEEQQYIAKVEKKAGYVREKMFQMSETAQDDVVLIAENYAARMPTKRKIAIYSDEPKKVAKLIAIV